jgi:hypothetical protein
MAEVFSRIKVPDSKIAREAAELVRRPQPSSGWSD